MTEFKIGDLVMDSNGQQWQHLQSSKRCYSLNPIPFRSS